MIKIHKTRMPTDFFAGIEVAVRESRKLCHKEQISVVMWRRTCMCNYDIISVQVLDSEMVKNWLGAPGVGVEREI